VCGLDLGANSTAAQRTRFGLALGLHTQPPPHTLPNPHTLFVTPLTQSSSGRASLRATAPASPTALTSPPSHTFQRATPPARWTRWSAACSARGGWRGCAARGAARGWGSRRSCSGCPGCAARGVRRLGWCFCCHHILCIIIPLPIILLPTLCAVR